MMWKTLLVALFVLPIAPAVAKRLPQISYTFRYLPGEANALRVEFSFEAGPQTQTRLLLPTSWDGQRELYRCVRNLKAESPGAAVVETERAAVKLVTHPSRAKVILSYDLVSDVGQKPLTGGLHVRPLINEQYFYLLANASLVLPDFPERNAFRFTVEWIGFPRSWTLANSFGVNQTRQRFQATLYAFNKRATFLGGDFRIEKIRADGGSLYLATRGKWLFPEASLKDLIERLERQQRAIWQDEAASYSLIIVFPTDEQVGNVAGEGRTGSSSVYVSKETEVPHQFAPLLSHEMFHRWNPHRLNLQDERLYWFGEGFTDFYQYLILLRLGLLGPQQFVAAANQIIRSYYTSPFRNLPADQMIVERRKSYEAEKVPYQQGFLLAINWNARIFEATKGKKSPDDAMRALLRRARSKGFVLSNKEIVDAILAAGGGEVSGEIDAAIVRGETIQLSPNALGPCAVATVQSFEVFDLGFDLDELRRTKVFSAVKPKSAAYAAGLRDGQKWAGGIDLVRGDPGRLAKFEVEDASGRRTVSFYPVAGEKAEALQFDRTRSRGST